jgi:hypothetical protein
MGLVYSGALSLGPLCPLAVSGAAAAAADLVTRLGVFTDMSAFLVATPPSFAVALSDTIALIASLTLNIALLVPTPITVQVSGAVAIIAQLEAQIALLTPLIDLFDAAGIFVYAFDGVTSSFGRGMARALSAGFPGAAGASAHANAIILATVTPATWTGLKAFFQGMPVPPAGAGVVYGGSTSIVSLIPILRRALFGVYSSLQARLAGYVKLVAQFSGTLPTPVGAIDAMTGLKAALQAAIAAGPPAADFFLQAAIAGIAALNAAAALVAQLQALFGIAGIFVYKFDGATSELGPAITTSLASGWPDSSPPTLNANALVLGTVTPSTWTALQAFFGGA